MSLSRRGFILSSAGLMFQTGLKENLIVRSPSPTDLETPVHLLDGAWLTPNDLHYVRSHLLTPRVDLGAFTLTVEGEVNQPLRLTLDELRAFREVNQVV